MRPAHEKKAIGPGAAGLTGSAELFHALVEQAQLGMCISDGDRFIYVNQRMAEIFGYARDEMLAIGPRDIAAPSDLPMVRESLRRRLSGEQSTDQYTFRGLRADGTEFDVEVHGSRAELDGQPVVIGTLHDVTRRRESEEALRRSEARFRSLIENASESVAILDETGTVVYLSRAVRTILGYESHELLGRSALDFLHPDDAPAAAEALRSLVAEPGASRTLEVRALEIDGTLRILQVHAENRLDEPAVGGIVANFRDLTEERRLEEQLRHAQKMEAVGRLAGGVAHDFNNLLTGIFGYAEFLLEDTPEGDPRRGDILEIQQAATRARDLTRQLLAFSRRQVLQPALLDLNDAIAGMEKLLRRVIGEDVELVTDLRADPGTTIADPGQIEQVVMNLAVNARDAMPAGGRLTIATRNARVREGEGRGFDSPRPGDYVVLTVADTGSGMDEATLGHIFEPFFTTKEQGKGTGLGLATVYGIVRQSGGAVEAESRPGRGTTFDVYLPTAVAPPAEGAAPGDGGAADVESATLLLAEDEDSVRTLMRRMLVAQGFRVLEAADGAAALEVARDHAGDIRLLITDVVMPGMGGRELAERLSAERPDIRVIYTSGYTDDDILRHGIEEGRPFLAKPFLPDELERVVRDVLRE